MVKLKQIFAVIAVFLLGAVNAETILIKNAKVYTLGTQGTLEKADILIADGKITSVGTDIPAADGVKVVDASGKHITPGLFNAHTQIGLTEIGAVDSTRDFRTSEKKAGATFSPVQAFNPDSTLISLNRANGLTRAMLVPSVEKSILNGKGSIVNMTGSMDSVVLKDNAVYMNYGADSAEEGGGSRAMTLQMIHEMFADLASYDENAEDFKAKSSLKKDDAEALMPVFRGEIPLVVDVDRASDIKAMLDLQKQYNLKMVLSSAVEAWRLAGQIAEQGVAVLINPYSNLPSGFDTIGVRFDGAAILANAGVELIISNRTSHKAYVLRESAGNAVTHGLDPEVALKSISLTPAKWFGIGESFGSIEAGKDADLVIWDGDPLEITSIPDAVYIMGEETSLVSRQTRLRDRYMKDSDWPAAYNK